MIEIIFAAVLGYLARWIQEQWRRNPAVPVRPRERHEQLPEDWR